MELKFTWHYEETRLAAPRREAFGEKASGVRLLGIRLWRESGVREEKKRKEKMIEDKTLTLALSRGERGYEEEQRNESPISKQI